MFIRKGTSDSNAKGGPDDEQPNPQHNPAKKRRRDDRASVPIHCRTKHRTADRMHGPYFHHSQLTTTQSPTSSDCTIGPTVPHAAASTASESSNLMLDPRVNWSSLGCQRQMMDQSLGSSLIPTPPRTGSLHPNLDSLTHMEMLRLEQQRIMRSQSAEFNGIDNAAVADFLGTENPLALPSHCPGRGTTSTPTYHQFDALLPQFGVYPNEQGSLFAATQLYFHQLDSQIVQLIRLREQGLTVAGATASNSVQTHHTVTRDTNTQATRPPKSSPGIVSPSTLEQRDQSNARVDRPEQTRILTLCIDQDREKLNENQIYLRQQIEVFRATHDDLGSRRHGKAKPIVLGQVGVRCRHCGHLPMSRRYKASTYFPKNLMGIYQAAQNISVEHLQSGLCPALPSAVSDRFSSFAPRKLLASGGGKKYWEDAGKVLGLVDTDDGIRFAEDLNPAAKIGSTQPASCTQQT